MSKIRSSKGIRIGFIASWIMICLLSAIFWFGIGGAL